MYRQILGYDGETPRTDVILRVADNANIPCDNANTDYQAYLAWVAEGNAILPPE